MKVALITGITGQDGSYLAELLLEKKYQVWGIIRRCSNFNTQRIDHLYSNDNLLLRYGDLSDSNCLLKILNEIKSASNLSRLEVYNLGAMSHVKVSFDMPEYTGDIDGLGTWGWTWIHTLLSPHTHSPISSYTLSYLLMCARQCRTHPKTWTCGRG